MAVALVAASARGYSEEDARGTAKRPNIVVVMTDDQRADDLEYMPRTRRLIGRKGTTFTRSYATFPLCCPSRASYLTGQYAHNHGVRDNEPPDGGVEAFDDGATTALALQAAGYRTGWIGKYLNGYASFARATHPPYVPPGYDTWRASLTPGQMYGWRQLADDEVREFGARNRDYQTDVIARQSRSFVRRNAEKKSPFFLTVMPPAPHSEKGRNLEPRFNPRPARRHRGLLEDAPFPVSPAYNERDVSDKPSFVRKAGLLDRAQRHRIEDRYHARIESLLAVDELVRDLVKALRNEGLLRETLILFTSDNGYILGEHRVSRKDYVYEESARVPLLVRGPGIPAGRKLGTLTANIDLARTIYDASGVSPLLVQDGVSLLNVAAAPATFADRSLLLETTRSVAVRNGPHVYAEHPGDSPEAEAELELYDLRVDPYQLESVHPDHGQGTPSRQRRRELDALLEQLRDCQGPECR